MQLRWVSTGTIKLDTVAPTITEVEPYHSQLREDGESGCP
jgi:hypothetical protein